MGKMLDIQQEYRQREWTQYFLLLSEIVTYLQLSAVNWSHNTSVGEMSVSANPDNSDISWYRILFIHCLRAFGGPLQSDNSYFQFFEIFLNYFIDDFFSFFFFPFSLKHLLHGFWTSWSTISLFSPFRKGFIPF